MRRRRLTAETAEVVDEKPRKSGKWKAAQPVKEVPNAGLTVRLYEDIGHALGSMGSSTNSPVQSLDFEEAMALDEEIAFRQAPVFEPFVIEPTTPAACELACVSQAVGGGTEGAATAGGGAAAG